MHINKNWKLTALNSWLGNIGVHILVEEGELDADVTKRSLVAMSSVHSLAYIYNISDASKMRSRRYLYWKQLLIVMEEEILWK
jgi:hypothetical protein